MSGSPYTGILKAYRRRRNKLFDKMVKTQGYMYGLVISFDNIKGIGMAENADGYKFLLHYKNMDRINYKVLCKGHNVHFKPGMYNESVIAEDIAIVY